MVVSDDDTQLLPVVWRDASPAGAPLRLGYLLAALSAGVALAPSLPVSPSWPLLALSAAAGWFGLARHRGWLLLVVFCLFGVALCQQRLFAPPHGARLEQFAGGATPLVVEGRVLTTAPRIGGRSFVDVAVTKISRSGIATSVAGGMRVYLDTPVDLTAGTRIRFLARPRLPRRFGIPGENDYPRHLATEGVTVTANLPSAAAFAVLGDAGGGFWRVLLSRARLEAGKFIDAKTSQEVAPLARALLIGGKTALEPSQRDLLGRGGIAHLFAISGLHLGLVGGLLYAGVAWFYRRSESLLLWAAPRRILPAVLLPLLFVYLLLTGAALPTRRAFLAASAGVWLVMNARRTTPLALWASIAFLLLCADPLILFEPSFQLSFAGVLGILLLWPRCRPLLSKIPRWARVPAGLWLVTLSASVATAPLVLWHFHLLAPAGLVTNLVAVPAVGLLALPLGLFGLGLLPLWPAGAAVAVTGSGWVIAAVLGFTRWIISWPPLAGWRYYQNPLELTAVFLVAAAILVPWPAPFARLSRGAFLLTAAVLIVMPWPVVAGLTVTALSVGQGESILMRWDDKTYLVDGGGLPGGTFDVGERLLAPALGRLGVRRLDAVILTHNHPDHRLGLLHVLDVFPVKEFWTTLGSDKLDPDLAAVLSRRHIPFRRFSEGWHNLPAGGGRVLNLFVPRQNAAANDRSLVLYARQGTAGVLLTGDLEADGVAQLLDDPPSGPVTLLKLPHHGSSGSVPERLVARFKPLLAFVSAGFGNSYHLPSASVTDALFLRQVPLYRTDLDGTVRFRTCAAGWTTSRWREGLFR